MKFFAIIVTYNRKNLLLECVQALQRQTHKLDKIIVVDNASSDGTHELMNDIEDKRVQYVRLKENLGGAGGFNHAISLAYQQGADWIWIMDDDAEPYINSLEKMVKSVAYKGEKTLGLAQLKVGLDSNIQRTHRGHFNYNRLSTIPLSEHEYSQEETKIDYCSFVGLMISRKAIDLVGLPKENYFIWYDDVEYCLRISQKGNIVLIKDSIILHKDGISGKGSTRLPIGDYWKAYYGQRNIIDIYINHGKGILGLAFLGYRFFLGIYHILKYDNYKFKRISLFLKAHYDGFSGNLGKNIDPSIYKNGLKDIK